MTARCGACSVRRGGEIQVDCAACSRGRADRDRRVEERARVAAVARLSCDSCSHAADETVAVACAACFRARGERFPTSVLLVAPVPVGTPWTSKRGAG